ncbi:MAG: class I SAM-dependent methyltransferase [Acidimicrobiia bacterium]
MADHRWSDYVQHFHAQHPGITEHILSRCRSHGTDPYRWCAETLAEHHGVVLDIACGSGPMAPHLRAWIGADRSAAELAVAADAARGPLVRTSATRLAIANQATGAVVCSMAMQVIQPVDTALAEMARVLRPGGRAVLLVPTTGPLGWRDALRYTRLQAALRQRIRYPNDRALRFGDRRPGCTPRRSSATASVLEPNAAARCLTQAAATGPKSSAPATSTPTRRTYSLRPPRIPLAWTRRRVVSDDVVRGLVAHEAWVVARVGVAESLRSTGRGLGVGPPPPSSLCRRGWRGGAGARDGAPLGTAS